MKRNGWLTTAGYFLSLYLICVPLVETGLATYPVGLGEPAWRFGAAGLLSQALMTPLLGVLIASGIAVAAEHWRLLRIISVPCAAAAVVLAVVLPTFILDAGRITDALELAGAAGTAGPGGTTAVVLAGGVKFALAIVILAAVAWGGWTAAARVRASETSPSAKLVG